MLTTVNFAPFIKVQALHHHLRTQNSRFLLRKTKRKSQHHRGRSDDNCGFDDIDNFNFDDSEYFNQLNRPWTQQKNTESFKQINGRSQIIKVKKMSKQSVNKQESVSNLSTLLLKNIRSQVYKPLTLKKSSFSHECKSQKPSQQINYKNQFICSANKKSYATLDPRLNERPLTNDIKFDQTIDNQNQTVLIVKDYDNKRSKSFSVNKSCGQINQVNCRKNLHRNIKKGKNQYDSKRSQTRMQYSILKPNQIKTIPLTCRQEFKTHESLKGNDQKQLYMEMVLQIKRKQQFLRKSIALQREKQLFYRQQRQIDIRSKIHTSQNTRRTNRVQEKNQLNPWEVEGNFNLTDII